MKSFISIIFLAITCLYSQLTIADSCGLTKSLFEQGKYERAFNHALTYAKYGDACANYYIGVMYHTGQGVRQNNTKSVQYLNKAARKGYLPAKHFLANRGG